MQLKSGGTESPLAFRPVYDEDLAFLTSLAQHLDGAWLRLAEGGASTPYHFRQALWDGVLSVEIPYVQEPGDPVAVVSLFDTDERSAFAHGEVIVASAPESSTIERRAFDHLCKRAFF